MKNNIAFYLTVGLLASIVVGVGEWMLHYLPEGPDGEIGMLNKVPLKRASIGHFFAVLGTPLYIAGYYGLMKWFRSTSDILSKAFFSAGVFSFFIGGIWLSSRYYAAEVFQKSVSSSDYDFYVASYVDHYQVLVWLLRILISIVSILYIVIILKNKINLPKWLAIINPIVLLLFVFSLLIWLPKLGFHLAPIAMNAAHLIFFSILLFYYRKTN